jgi:hypothetical protein
MATVMSKSKGLSVKEKAKSIMRSRKCEKEIGHLLGI